jgi:hypothetical protein
MPEKSKKTNESRNCTLENSPSTLVDDEKFQSNLDDQASSGSPCSSIPLDSLLFILQCEYFTIVDRGGK